MAQGSALKAIAEKLSISELTVRKHLQNIRNVLQVHNAAAILNAVHRGQVMQSSPLRLTQRGMEVFTLILMGMSMKQIAVELGISFSCVRRHKEKMLLCNQCTTINELIAKHYGHTEENSADILNRGPKAKMP